MEHYTRSHIFNEKLTCKDCACGIGKTYRTLNPGEEYYSATCYRSDRSERDKTIKVLCKKHFDRRRMIGSAKLIERPKPVLPEPEPETRLQIKQSPHDWASRRTKGIEYYSIIAAEEDEE